MNTRIDLSQILAPPEFIEQPLVPALPEGDSSAIWNAEEFGDEQIRSLVRRLFLPGWPKPLRQVVLTSIEPDSYIADICIRIARALSAEMSGSIAVVEANANRPELETVFGRTEAPRQVPSPTLEWRQPDGCFRTLRDDSIRLASRIWLVPWKAFRGEPANENSTAAMRDRFGELRLDFDFTILHGPVAASSEVALLGALTDGIVFVLEAGKTRRAAAQSAKARLQAANVKILGSVLSERAFPIPAGIYRKL